MFFHYTIRQERLRCIHLVAEAITLLDTFRDRLAERHTLVNHLCCMGHTATAESLLDGYGERYIAHEETFKHILTVLHKARRRGEYGICKKMLYRFSRNVARDIPESLSDPSEIAAQELFVRRRLWERKREVKKLSDMIHSAIQSSRSPCPSLVSQHQAHVRKKKALSRTYTLRTFHEISSAHAAFEALLAEGRQLASLALHARKPSS